MFVFITIITRWSSKPRFVSGDNEAKLTAIKNKPVCSSRSKAKDSPGPNHHATQSKQHQPRATLEGLQKLALTGTVASWFKGYNPRKKGP